MCNTREEVLHACVFAYSLCCVRLGHYVCVYVCMYVCMCVCVCMYVCVCVYIYIYIFMCVCVYIYIYICVYEVLMLPPAIIFFLVLACMHVCMYLMYLYMHIRDVCFVCVCVCFDMCVCVCVLMYMRIQCVSRSLLVIPELMNGWSKMGVKSHLTTVVKRHLTTFVKRHVTKVFDHSIQAYTTGRCGSLRLVMF
jgi:hypothetical protein